MKYLIDELRNLARQDSWASEPMRNAADALESQAREIAGLKEGQDSLILARDEQKRLASKYRGLWSKAAVKAQPCGVVLPPSPYMPGVEPSQLSDYERGEAQGRCDMWAELARLNQPASAGDERAAGDPCSCTDGRCGTRPTSFSRETRYVVFKLNKLDQKQLARLNGLLNVSGPEGIALPTVDCVVVERDWPEFQPVWAMIEARVTGQARAALSAKDSEQVPDATQKQARKTWRAGNPSYLCHHCNTPLMTHEKQVYCPEGPAFASNSTAVPSAGSQKEQGK